MMLAQEVKKFVEMHGMLSSGDRVLVAVSGGPDSVALLHLLYELRGELGLHLEVAHLEHGIRAGEAEGDARFVEQLADELKLPFHLKKISIPAIRSQAGGGNIEALARRERYGFLAQVARREKLNKVATAHTRDDQAETVLMWLLRGAGRKGLAGIAPRQSVNLSGAKSSKYVQIIRPLLGLTKKELVDFLTENELGYRLDRTNEDLAFRRNWIRLELMPRLMEKFDPRLPVRLAHSAEVLGDEEELLGLLSQQALRSVAGKNGLSRERLLLQPKALQRRVIRLWIEEVRGHLRGLDFDHIEALLKLAAKGPAQGRLALPGDWEFIREYGILRLAMCSRKARKSKRVCYCYPLVMGGETALPEAGMKLRSEQFAETSPGLPRDEWEATFDMGSLSQPLAVRNFRRGDRFQPLGLAGHRKKIKDLFIDNKVPLSARIVWPILVMGEEILWLPRYGRSEVGKITPNTRDYLRVTALITAP